MEPPALASLRNLQRFRASGTDRWFAVCPCHNERTASLRIALRDGKLLIHCFGCNAGARQILVALGLPWSSLWIDGKAPTKQARQAVHGLYQWHAAELDRLGRLIEGRYAVIEACGHRWMNQVEGVMLGAALRGLCELEWRYEQMQGAKGKDEILELWRAR